MQTINVWCEKYNLNCALDNTKLELNQNVVVKYQTNSTDDLFWKRARVIAKNEEEYVRIIFCPFFQYIIYSWFF